VLCVILTLGLWPFHAPPNEVAWLEDGNGVALGEFGNLVSTGQVNLSSSDRFTLELWVQPDKWQGSATILALYNPEKETLFSLRQSLTDLEVTAVRRKTPRSVGREAHFYVDAFGPALHKKTPTFVTLVSGPEATAVYIDGVLTKRAPGFAIPREVLAGQVIVGDAPRQSDSFHGKIRGLATYAAELSTEEIERHYQSWTRHGSPTVQHEHVTALYLFDERAGNVVHDRAANGKDLVIPRTYTNVSKIALEPFWSEFDMSGSYWRGILKNVVGFMPLGFCFYPYFLMARRKRPVLLTLLAGAFVSLTIEVFQAFLPTRDSGTTDIITNTIGTYVGVVLYKHALPIVVERFPKLAWLPALNGRGAGSLQGRLK